MKKQLLYMVGLTSITVFFLALFWEYVVEDRFLGMAGFEAETAAERWKHVLTSTALVAIALIAPSLLMVKAYRERREAGAALEENEEQLRVLINSMPDVVIFKDGEGRWVKANDFALKVFDLQGVDYKGKDDSELGGMVDFHRDALLYCVESDKVAWEKSVPSRLDEAIPQPEGDPKNFDVIKVPLFHSDGARKGLVVVGRDITERKAVEEALKSSEEKTKAIIATVGEGIISIGQDSVIRFVNRELCNIFGYTEDELVGENLKMLMPERYRLRHTEGLKEYLKTGRKKILGRRLELEGLRKDGSLFPLELRVEESRVKEGGDRFFTAAIRDITDRKQANEERLLLETAIEQVAEIIMVTDADGVIQYVNPMFQRVSGYSREEAIGKLPSILKSGRHDAKFYQELWGTIKSGEVWEGTIINKKKDGTLYEENTTISPVRDSSGKVINFVAVKRDASYENMLHKARDYFTNITAHELNTPLTRLQLVKVLLEDFGAASGDTEKFQQITTLLDDTFNELSRIISATTFMSDLSLQKTHKDFYAVYPYLILIDCVQRSRTHVEKEGRSITVKMDDSLPKDAELYGNQEMIVKVFDEVLSNAIKYTPDGKGVVVSGKVSDGNFVIEVTDEGVGIPAERIEQVFEPYFSLENVLHHSTGLYRYKGGGIGLGLTLTRMIMDYHGGSLALTSGGKDMGTRVTITFPLAPTE